MPITETAAVERRASSAIHVRVARTLPEVEALRESWTAWGGHRDSDIDFYLTILKSYPEVVRPHVIALYRDGELDAILIGRLEHKRLGFRIGYFTLFRPWSRCLTFVYGALRGNGSPENTRLLVDELKMCLRRKEADIALLEYVPLESPLYQLAMEMPGLLGRDTLPAAQGHHRMVIPDSVEGVYRNLSGSRKKEIRRSVKKLGSHPAGELKIVCYRHESEMERFFRDSEEIAKKTYQRGLGATIADTPQMRMRMGIAVEKGWLRAYLLYLGDRPCAFWIGMLYGETFVSEFMGYDPEFRQFSPGTVLLTRVLEGFTSGADGDVVKDLDFGLGTADYKALFGTESWSEAAVFVFGPTLKGLVLKLLRTSTQVVDGTARRFLARTNLMSRIKRLWRNRLAHQED